MRVKLSSLSVCKSVSDIHKRVSFFLNWSIIAFKCVFTFCINQRYVYMWHLFKYLSENQWLHDKICLVTVLKWLQNVTSWSSEAQGVSFLVSSSRHLPVPLLTSCPSAAHSRSCGSQLSLRSLPGPCWGLTTLPMSFPQCSHLCHQLWSH